MNSSRKNKSKRGISDSSFRLLGIALLVVICAGLGGLFVRLTSAEKFKQSAHQQDADLAAAHSSLSLANDELESLFGELVGNLEQKQIELDRSARIVLRRGQKVCSRIAATSTSPVKRASAYCTLGHIHYHLQDVKAAVNAYRAALDCVSGLATSEAMLVRAYATNNLVQSLAMLGYEGDALSLSKQLRASIEATSPPSFALMDELSLTLRNEAILVASESALPEAIPVARANLEVLNALLSVKGREATLVERQVDAYYLLAGLLWRNAETRAEAVSVLREVSDAADTLWRGAGERLQAGESLGDYARYKSEARRAKRELALAESTVAPNDDSAARAPSFWTRENLFNGRRSVGTEILLDDLQMIAEFEEQEAVLLRWSGLEWQDGFTRQLIELLQDRVKIILLVNDNEAESEAREALTRQSSSSNVMFQQIPANTVWVRDYGPLSVVGRDGYPVWIDYQHLRPDERTGNDLLTARLARSLGNRLIRSPLLIEGGNVLTNGQDIVVCTSQLQRENMELGFTSRQFHRRLGQLLGCEQVVVLEELKREGTGHVDWFMTFVSPTDVVVGAYDKSTDAENAEVLDRNAELLGRLRTSDGPLRVHRIPMPPHPPTGFGGTYTNVVFANGLLIVPIWDQATSDTNQQALDLYKKLLPNWKVVGMNCSGMLPYSGAIHCATVNLPKLPVPYKMP